MVLQISEAQYTDYYAPTAREEMQNANAEGTVLPHPLKTPKTYLKNVNVCFVHLIRVLSKSGSGFGLDLDLTPIFFNARNLKKYTVKNIRFLTFQRMPQISLESSMKDFQTP
jgi:hypothetical protein